MKALKLIWLVSIVPMILISLNQEAASSDEGVPQDTINRLGPTRPDCSTVEINGFAVGGDPTNLKVVEQALSKSSSFDDFQRFLAANPLMCSPSAMTQTYYCKGVTGVSGNAVITSWGKDYYEIVQPLLFDGGYRLTMLYLERGDAKCVDNIKPKYGRYDNVLSARRKTDW